MASTIVSPWILIIIIAVIAISVHYSIFYLSGARDTRRLESTIKSPIFEHYTQALQGISTIRAFGRATEYTKTMFKRLDRHGQILFYMTVFKRWLGWQLNVVGAIFVTVIAIAIVQGSNMDASLGGFALTFALSYTDLIFYSLRNYVELELGMNSIERIVEYTTMETEDQSGADVPAIWPTEGRLEVEDLVVSYAKDLPPVLKNLTFTVEPRQRVGVVGRTGAGKSSLTLALFRFLEPRQGSIRIDGIDIGKIRVQDLRSRLAIIPQDPVLFSGTVRSNLDPFDEHGDDELKEALRRVHLTSDAPPTPDPSGSGSGTLTPDRNAQNANVFESLASAVSEGGQNLSQGQRQLLCLARAIVSHPKMMVLDEATSAVDKTTDALIQRSIRDGFGDATLVVIAHRLSTIADFDRILVLDEGRIVEYDTPRALFEKKDGVFRGMVETSGENDVLVDVIMKGDTN
jgi:ABC-type multidrug transport system fused ATPase/permease subunit